MITLSLLYRVSYCGIGVRGQPPFLVFLFHFLLSYVPAFPLLVHVPVFLLVTGVTTTITSYTAPHLGKGSM